MTRYELLEILKEYLKGAKIDCFVTEVKGIPVLKATLTGLGDKRDGSAITEINFIDFDELGAPALQAFTTVALNLDKDNLEPCELELRDYNLKYVIIGSFHVYEPYRQIYHRYAQVLVGDDAEQVEQAKAMLNVVSTQISACYDDILRYAEDAE